jgi:hypothetical protein
VFQGAESQIEEEDSDDEKENAFLKNVYLQKSPYVIKGTSIEQIED